MDLEPGRTRVHEHAETGRPLAALKLHGTQGRIGADLARPFGVARPCDCQGWNGPAIDTEFAVDSKVGHKLSAIGLPYHAVRSVCSACPRGHSPLFAQFAARKDRRPRGFWHTSDSKVIPSAHPLSFRFRASLSDLAVNSAGERRWTERYDGKRDMYFQHSA
jgi:hypothetical protein